MTQIMIKAKNRQDAKEKFLAMHPNKEIYNITKTFYSHKKTPPDKRVYRVTGVTKGSLTKSGKPRKKWYPTK